MIYDIRHVTRYEYGSDVTYSNCALRLLPRDEPGQIVYASPTDGSVTATVETKQPFSLPPVVANSTLYTIDDGGRVSAYR